LFNISSACNYAKDPIYLIQVNLHGQMKMGPILATQSIWEPNCPNKPTK